MTSSTTFTRRVVLAGVTAGAMALSAGGAVAQDTIKIGVITDQTGPAKFYADPVTEGSILAAKWINANGGVLGKKIELVIEDDGAKPDVSASKARKLVDEGVVAILSNSSSPATQQQQTVTLATKTPQVTPSNSSDWLTTRIKNPYFFQLGPLASTQIKTLMSYARDKKFKQVAIVRDYAGLSKIIGDVFEKALTANGIKVVAYEVLPQGSTTAVPQMQKIRAAKPDAIFQAGIIGPQMVQFFRAYHQLGMKQPILGSFNLSIPAYLKIAKGLMEGVAFIDAYDPDKAQTKAFIAYYKKETGREPFSLPGYGWDGIMFIADAIKHAGSTDKEAIRKAMQDTKGWVGVMGAKGATIEMRDGGRKGFDPEGATVRVIKDNGHGPVVHSGTK